jgi:hypothetical protein
LRDRTGDLFAAQVEHEKLIAPNGCENQMVQTSEMRLRLYIAVARQRWVEKHIHLERVVRSGAARASPPVNRSKNLL